MTHYIYPKPEEWWDERKAFLWKLDDPSYEPTEEDLERLEEVREWDDIRLTRKPRSLQDDW